MPAKSRYKTENTILIRMLREMRSDAGFTQVTLAQEIDRTQSYVSKIESGERRIDLLQLREYCLACRVSLTSFVKRFESELQL